MEDISDANHITRHPLQNLFSGGPNKAALVFIFVTVALDMLAVGMIVPVLPGLVKSFLGGDTARAAKMLGIFGTVWALMQFLFSPLLGCLSDRFGRRPVILLSNFGTGVDYFVMALAPTLNILFLGRVISGITSASIPTAMAYIADVTPAAERAAGFGMISAAFGLGFVLGPAFGGMLGNINPRLPFWVAGALSLANALYGLFVLPESLPRSSRGRFSWLRANPVGGIGMLRLHPNLFALGAVMFFGYLAQQVFEVYVLYTQYRYRWNDQTVGLSLALVGISSALVGAVLVKPVVKKFGDRAAMIAGLLFGSLGFAIFGLAATGIVFSTGIPVMNLWGFAGPTAQGIMSRGVGPSEQGQLQGAISALRGIASLIGPILFTFVFARALSGFAGWRMPGAPFYLAAALLVGSLLLALRVTRDGRSVDATTNPQPGNSGASS